MPHEAALIIQLARGSAVERQFEQDRPASVAGGAVVVDIRPADANGRLEPPDAGQVVLSVPSPETLTREPDEVRRVIDGAGAGVEPLVVVVEAADELRDDQLAVLLAAAEHTSHSVVLRVMRDG
jgi:hypothetical protein